MNLHQVIEPLQKIKTRKKFETDWYESNKGYSSFFPSSHPSFLFQRSISLCLSRTEITNKPYLTWVSLKWVWGSNMGSPTQQQGLYQLNCLKSSLPLVRYTFPFISASACAMVVTIYLPFLRMDLHNLGGDGIDCLNIHAKINHLNKSLQFLRGMDISMTVNLVKPRAFSIQ